MFNKPDTALTGGSYVAFVGGSSKGNPGPGGYAYRLYSPDTGEYFQRTGKSRNATTSNKAVLQATIAVLETVPEGEHILICTNNGYLADSFENHLENWASNGWKTASGKEVQNMDRWKAIEHLADWREVSFCSAQGHPDLEDVRVLAGEAADRAAKQRR